MNLHLFEFFQRELAGVNDVPGTASFHVMQDDAARRGFRLSSVNPSSRASSIA